MIEYEVILAGQYNLKNNIETIRLDEQLDDIAYRATIQMVVTPDFPGISPGQGLVISGNTVLFTGVVWTVDSSSRGLKHLEVTAYDRTIYLAKSEDEYFFPVGLTATQRFAKYAGDWGIPLGSVADTGFPLPKDVYRAQSIYNMIKTDLQNTVTKGGGGMYRPRFSSSGLDLVKLGANKEVWMLEHLEDTKQERTMEGTVTQVKVLGQESENQRTPVLAIVKGETDKYGTLQKILQSDRVKTAAHAKTAGQKLLAGITESFTTTCPDMPELRAGDKVTYSKMDLLVTEVQHELGNPGHMTLTLMAPQQVQRRFYADGA